MTEADEAQGFWKRWETRVGVIAAVVGLLFTIADHFAKFFGGPSEKQKVEVEQKRAEAAASAPHLDASYVLLGAGVLGTSEVRPSKSKAAITVRSFPSIENEVSAETNRMLNGRLRGCGSANHVSEAFLVLTNRGRRDATDVTVQTQRLVLRRSVGVREPPAGRDDYVQRLRSAAPETSPATIRIPRTLGPGEGVRVPLFWSVANPERPGRWCVASRRALLPSSLRFTDAALDKDVTAPVRRMLDPISLDVDIVGRG